VFYAGLGVVFVCVFGGYIVAGGNILIVLEAAPHELLTILGAAVGAYLIGTPKNIISKIGVSFNDLIKGSPYTKESYLELISLLYLIFKLAKNKGMLAIEPHIENPKESSIFQKFPTILNNHHVVEFVADYLRMMTMGSDNPHQMEDIINEELEVHHHEKAQMAGVFSSMSDGLPALGIVAAVLGVIKTMAAIDQPPIILGKMIGGALVGTFLGVFLAYGIIGPIANSLNATYAEEGKYYNCIKIAFIAYLNGAAPAIAIEYARKVVPIHLRPSFYDVESKMAELPNPS
jgi:chemotaxis protein MotA